MSNVIVEEVFINRDDTNLVTFFEDNVSIDFSTVTRFELKIGTQTVDTAIDASSIVTTAVTGQLKFTLGVGLTTPLTKTDGPTATCLIAYDQARPNGQIIVSANSKLLNFNVLDC